MPSLYYLGLCAIAKDETPFLREWVAYHHYIGFEKIYIYDNESRIPVRDGIAEFYDLQICDSYTMPGQSMQLVAYNHCLKQHGHEFEWLAFFDLDEFLCLLQDKDARTFLQDYEEFSGLSINWSSFSSSGKLSRPEGLVMENYTRHMYYSTNSKCIVRPARIKMPFTAHNFIYNQGFAVNANRQRSLGAYTPLAIDKIRLNHYCFKSQQDYCAKVLRGNAACKEFSHNSMAAFYAQAEVDYPEETSILPMTSEVRQMLEQGNIRQRQELRFSEILNLTLPKAVNLLSTFINAGKFDLAEVLFALCRLRFSAKADFLRLGISLCQKCKKYDRMKNIVLACLNLEPEQERELLHMLLESLLLSGRTMATQETADFLLEIARTTRNAKLEEQAQNLLRKLL